MQRKNKVFLGVSAVTTPQGVSRFATVPWQYPKNHFYFFKQKGKQGKQSKQGQQSQQSQPWYFSGEVDKVDKVDLVFLVNKVNKVNFKL